MSAAHDTQALTDSALDAVISATMNGCWRAYEHDDVRAILRAALASRLQEQEGQPALSDETRAEAVNLSRNMLTVRDCKGITTYGVRVLAEAVMKMDAVIAGGEACPHADEPRGCYRVRCQLGRKCVGEAK